MDTLTHIVLGACIGEVLATKKVGKKALVLGAVTQSIPDFVKKSFCDDIKTHCFAIEKLGIKDKPKHHLMVEMGGRFLATHLSMRLHLISLHPKISNSAPGTRARPSLSRAVAAPRGV